MNYEDDDFRGQRRGAKMQDICVSTRLLDALDGVTTKTPFFTPQDTPGKMMALTMYRYALPNTTKPLHSSCVQNSAEVKYIPRMAERAQAEAECILNEHQVPPLDQDQ